MAFGTGAAANEIPITNPALIATDEARERLRYLASCALETGTVLVGVQAGTEYRFPGAMALAPDWGTRALTAEERRWVSACMFARTNAFGATVLISMRADPAPGPALEAGAEERASHTLYEGGYFGDIFADPPQAYVCQSRNGDTAALERRLRVCALPQEPGQAFSHCGFALVSPCDAGAPPVIDGTPWPEVVHVWLEGAEPP